MKRALLILLLLAPAAAAPAADPVAALDAYHAALKQGDTAGALKLLTDDALLFEQGYLETRHDYAGAHIGSDARFAAVTEQSVLERKLLMLGDDAACVVSQTRTRGSFQGHRLDLIGTETALLERHGDEWLIRHLHSSAHPAEAAAPHRRSKKSRSSSRNS